MEVIDCTTDGKSFCLDVDDGPTPEIQEVSNIVENRGSRTTRESRTSLDKCKNGQWLWMCVTVGKGTKRYTHENRLKKITFAMLPRMEFAPNKRPRGIKALQTCSPCMPLDRV